MQNNPVFNVISCSKVGGPSMSAVVKSDMSGARKPANTLVGGSPIAFYAAS